MMTQRLTALNNDMISLSDEPQKNRYFSGTGSNRTSADITTRINVIPNYEVPKIDSEGKCNNTNMMLIK